jgi:4-amino-4-deoxy-L-arabinose transferase-like glycosyltransferase
MAKHGLAGLSLAQAMRQFDLVEFVTELNAMSTWPPAFPLLEAPFFLLFGDDYATPRCLVSVIHVVLIVAAIWAGWSVFPRRGLAVGGLTGMLLAVSPMVLVYSALVMLEVPGTTLLLLALASYLAAIDQPSKLRWRLAFLSATTLFFCKYNYGLI